MKISLLLFAIVLSAMFSCTPPSTSESQFIQNQVIAHRGAWRAAGLPQNSIASLKQAVEIGCMGSEFDVWMTSDGVLLLNHDADYEGLVLETSTYDEMLAKRLSNGERLPTAEEILRQGMTQKKTKLIMEVKPSKISTERGQELAAKSVELVHKMGAQDWVDYITFDKHIGSKIIELDPNANVAYLMGDKTPQELKDEGYFGFDYNIKVVRENPHWIKEAKELGLTVNVWTVDKKEDWEWLLEQDVDFITTDEPELLLEFINSSTK